MTALDSDRSGHDASPAPCGRPAAPDHATVPAPDLHRSLAETDPQVHAAIAAELRRQQTTLEMIASENFAPVAVMQAQGSVLTNKYAEGYPGRRYYGGCEHVDVIEQLAIDRLKALFGAEYANVQPHSGAQANAAAMAALLQPGDTILGLDLAHGGHLTHGMRLNFSGKLYNVAAYHVRPRGPPRRHGRGRAARPRAPAQADHRRLVGLPAPAGLRGVPADRRRGRRLPDGRHGALRRPGRRRAAPVAGAARPRGHLHHPQDPRRPPRRRHPGHRRAGQEVQLVGVPRPAGRPAGARHRGQGRGLQARRRAGLPRAPGAHPRRRPDPGRPAAGRRLPRGRGRRGQRRHRRPPGAGRPARVAAGRQAGRGPAALGRHHGQPQRRAVRPAAADGQLRRPHRHPGAGRPRLRRSTTSPRSPTSSPWPCGPTLDDVETAAAAGPGHPPRRAPPALPGPVTEDWRIRHERPRTPGADLPEHPDFLWRNPEPKKLATTS